MKRLLYAITVIGLLYSCGGDDGPSGGGTANPTAFKACFTQEIDGGIVSFNSDCSEGGTSYLWNFGDGNTFSEENPVHEYSEPGTYSVTLTLSRNFGTSTTDITSIIEIEEFCINCECLPGSSTPSSEFCGTKQQADSSCIECNTIVECACDSINVDDGIYIIGSASSPSPTFDFALQDGVIDDFGNEPPFLERPGYYEGLMYLKSGDINVMSVSTSGNEIFGGSFTTEAIGIGQLQVGSLELNGASLNLSTAGLYWISVDLSSGTWYVMEVLSMEIIGPANEGWSAGSELTLKSADENQVVFEGTDLNMELGEFRFRINSNWNIDRSFANPPISGLNMLTNFGSTINGGGENSDLQSGGYNFTFEGLPGKYTITFTHSPGLGYNLESEFTRTGDQSPFDPENYNWGLIGSATANGWSGPDFDFQYRGDQNGEHLWVGMIWLQDGEFKYRANDAWDIELGPNVLDHMGSAASQISETGDFVIDIPNDEGFYYIKITTADEGLTWNVSIEPGTWGIVGAATPGGWDNSTPMVYLPVGGWEVNLNLSADEYKFRVNDEWEINLGGTLTNLDLDGTNLSISTSGNYTVLLFTTDFGLTYQAQIF